MAFGDRANLVGGGFLREYPRNWHTPRHRLPSFQASRTVSDWVIEAMDLSPQRNWLTQSTSSPIQSSLRTSPCLGRWSNPFCPIPQSFAVVSIYGNEGKPPRTNKRWETNEIKRKSCETVYWKGRGPERYDICWPLTMHVPIQHIAIRFSGHSALGHVQRHVRVYRLYVWRK